MALYSVTKAGCELISCLTLPLLKLLGIHFLFPHSLLGGREANEVVDFKKSSLQVGAPFPRRPPGLFAESEDCSIQALGPWGRTAVMASLATRSLPN